MNEFDLKAPLWDTNPMHLERSKAIADMLVKQLPVSRKMSALEYGAGTGLLSFLLKDHLREITLMDSSEGMLTIIKEKVAHLGINNLKPVLIDLEKESYSESFDFIFNQMVLHHVKDIDKILEKFYSMITPGGFIAIADLYPEDGSFHGMDVNVHKGFDPEKLAGKLSNCQFRNISYERCFTVRKDLGNNETKEYPVFLMTAGK